MKKSTNVIIARGIKKLNFAIMIMGTDLINYTGEESRGGLSILFKIIKI